MVPSAEIKPTPTPAKKRPARNSGRDVAAVWKTTPTLKIQHDTMRPQRRPMLSPSNGDARAPKKVPADRIETTAEVSEGETSK